MGRGQFTDDIGEDFLGLRELGIASEFGLSSLSIPKRLLKGKKNAKGPNATYGSLSPPLPPLLTCPFYEDSAKSAEPPPPYPPPSSFVLLTAEGVKNQIGLLRDFYERRLASASASGVAPVVLQDEPPNPAQTKLGPLGQVIRPSSAAIAAATSGSKKKSKPKDPTATVAAANASTAVPLTRAGGATAADAGTAPTAGTPAVVMGAAPGSMGVVQSATPVLSPQMSSASAPVSASVVLSATATATTGMATPMTTAGATPAPEQHTPKKKGAPGVGPGVGAGGAAAAASGGPGAAGAAGGGTGKKRGRPPEGLPPIVVASA